MKAQTSGVNEIVPLAAYQDNGYVSSNLEIVVEDVNGAETILGSLASPLTTLPSISCSSSSVYKVTVRSSINQRLQMASVGIMHTCDCTTTSLDQSLMPDQVPANPADAILYVAVG